MPPKKQTPKPADRKANKPGLQSKPEPKAAPVRGKQWELRSGQLYVKICSPLLQCTVSQANRRLRDFARNTAHGNYFENSVDAEYVTRKIEKYLKTKNKHIKNIEHGKSYWYISFGVMQPMQITDADSWSKELFNMHNIFLTKKEALEALKDIKQFLLEK